VFRLMTSLTLCGIKELVPGGFANQGDCEGFGEDVKGSQSQRKHRAALDILSEPRNTRY
jgi:hypothetical protein